MQLLLSIKLQEPCVLPIAYHHILQSAIYALIGGNLHNEDYKYDKRGYKLFTFGPIEGKYKIRGKSIIFFEEMSFEVRCYIDDIGLEIVKNYIQNGIRLINNVYRDVYVKVQNRDITENSLIINMKSPITVYETDEDRRTIYYNPEDVEFYGLIMDNFIRKYSAAFGELPDSNIEIMPVKYSLKDKYMTHYKGFLIEAWKGIYSLSGDSEYLKFLYDTGLGAKNSQGFGMFDILE